MLTSYLKHPLLSCENEWEDVNTNHDLDDDGFIFGGTMAAYLKGLVSKNINFAAL